MKVHFIGIGGIGVSALAQYYLAKRHQVSGSDLVACEITDFLKKKGVKIFIRNKAENIKKDLNLVIYSPAVKADNPELMQAKIYKIKSKSYPESLGELTRSYFTIAIAGAHGKSTTTAMIGLILAKAGLDPTVIVGTKLREFGNSSGEGSNFRIGKSKYLVIEACEYDSSFLNYSPQIIVMTNIDREHMDYFKTFNNVLKTFKNFAAKLPKKGFLVANEDDVNILKIKSQISKFKIQNYSLKQKEASKIKNFLKIPGSHNVANALAALTLARILNIKDEISFKSLSEYNGSWRRFEIKKGIANGKNITVVSDYGHHPNEVSATLKAAREKYAKKTIWLIFQPHQHQRTYYLFNAFVKVFKQAPINRIIITDIYDVAGREEKKITKKINSRELVRKIRRRNIQYLPVDQAQIYVKKNIANGDVLIIMGAGDIYKLAEHF